MCHHIRRGFTIRCRVFVRQVVVVVDYDDDDGHQKYKESKSIV